MAGHADRRTGSSAGGAVQCGRGVHHHHAQIAYARSSRPGCEATGCLPVVAQRMMGLIKQARAELQAELANVDAGYTIITRSAAKGQLLALLDIVVALASVRDLPNTLR